MQDKHTPGPWRVGRHYTDDEGYREIAIETTVRGVECVPASVVLQFVNCGGMQEANANLIAAAPELLDALRSAEAFIAGFEDDESQEGMRDNLLKIRAAITKATKT